ncbi:helix-turn-helix transcriptional regulator [Ramlibacter tataouinensis]|nr:AraC family transcriptional regulator [Ramlibacter tataouinensis]
MQPQQADPHDWARFQPGPVGGVTLMRAHFTRHTFERHSHETYSIGLTTSGVQAFHCRGALHASVPGRLILFNPDEAHDGQRGAPEGFGYSILYVPAEVVAQCRDPDAAIDVPRHFARPVVHDPLLARLYREASAAGAWAGESLRAEELMRQLLTGVLRRHGDGGWTDAARRAGQARMERVREYLWAHHARDLTVQELAGVAGLSRAHLTRAFSAHFGVPPHVHLNAVRLHRAQALLLAGRPLAEVALACGFADQSHFSRRFKGSFGVAPGRWLRQMLG